MIIIYLFQLIDIVELNEQIEEILTREQILRDAIDKIVKEIKE